MTPLTIDDEAAIAALTDLAQRQGKSVTTLVLELAEHAREELDREQPVEREPGLAERLMAIGDRTAPHIEEPWKSTPHGDLLYDEFGLPK